MDACYDDTYLFSKHTTMTCSNWWLWFLVHGFCLLSESGMIGGGVLEKWQSLLNFCLPLSLSVNISNNSFFSSYYIYFFAFHFLEEFSSLKICIINPFFKITT